MECTSIDSPNNAPATVIPARRIPML